MSFLRHQRLLTAVSKQRFSDILQTLKSTKFQVFSNRARFELILFVYIVEVKLLFYYNNSSNYDYYVYLDTSR